MTLFLEKLHPTYVCSQYISDISKASCSSYTRGSKTPAAQFTKLQNRAINNSHSEKRMKAHVFLSSTV